MSLTSIIILTLNNLEKTKQCLESIRTFTSEPYELIFVDNGSTDGTVAYLKQFSDIRLVCNPVNAGFAAGCNQGIRLANGEQILLLNNDTIVSHHWLENLLQALHISPRVGMVGPMTNHIVSPGVKRVKANYSDEHRFHQFARRFNQHDPAKWQPVHILYGFCLLFKRELLDKIGLLDERFGIGTREDVDYCYRASKAGYTLLLAGDTFIHHYGNATFKINGINAYKIGAENRKKFLEKWGPGAASFDRPFIRLIPDGTLLQSGKSLVYIDEQKRRPIKNMAVFPLLKWKTSDLVHIPHSQLSRYARGEMIGEDVFTKKIPNHLLIECKHSKNMYLIQNGRKRWIKNKETFDFYGYQMERVISLPRQIVDSIPDAPPLVHDLDHEMLLPNRIIFTFGNNYYLTVNHTLFPIGEKGINKLNLSTASAIRIQPSQLFRYPIGKAIAYDW